MPNIHEVKKYTKDLSILFVEDHEELRINTTNILNSIFKTVKTCENGEEALHEYTKFYQDNTYHYDIILSDIEMPLMNGIDLTKNIYKQNPSQVIIIISAFDDAKYLLALINIGIAQFIQKPLNSEELLKSFLEASKKVTKKVIPNVSNKRIEFNKNVFYNVDTKSINSFNENVYLTKFEIIFIELLLSSFGKIYSNEDIVTHYISKGESIDASNIRKLVSKLRKKLPQDSLESIYGIGYKFSTL